MTKELYKLILTYEVNGDSMQDYYQFVIGKYVPTMQEMGLNMIEAWTKYGDVPDRQLGFVSEDKQTVFDVIDSDNFEDLNDVLNDYVTDFEYKVVPYREGFQI